MSSSACSSGDDGDRGVVDPKPQTYKFITEYVVPGSGDTTTPPEPYYVGTAQDVSLGFLETADHVQNDGNPKDVAGFFAVGGPRRRVGRARARRGVARGRTCQGSVRFITEARSLRKVRSPHVIRVYDIGENDRQQPYLVLQHADRGTLADRVAALQALGWTPTAADVLVVARSLAAAVEAVHRADLVHRDLSPGNVLLCSSGELREGPTSSVVGDDERLVLADLGMCKDLAINSGLTAAAVPMGSVHRNRREART